jgi:hypothetical protein
VSFWGSLGADDAPASGGLIIGVRVGALEERSGNLGSEGGTEKGVFDFGNRMFGNLKTSHMIRLPSHET